MRRKALNAYIHELLQSDHPADQKLLLIRKLLPYCKNQTEKKQIIRAAGKIKTFLSLAFVSKFMEDSSLLEDASIAIANICLPSPGKKDGLSGSYVKKILAKASQNLTYPGSEYLKIDIREYLDNMPKSEGFVSMFNGKDLKGWQGLVENPIARSKMTKKQLEAAQSQANKKMHENWYVKEGAIYFDGDGHNLCSVKEYGDFEMLVDWKITDNGDSGIYLRGTPQVQIWDTARVDVSAQVGSGGLYNNIKNRSTPLVVADNPIGDWNTFRISMKGDRATVYLNGILVVDDVVMENYWDRKIPIFPKGPIELQAHGNELGFRDLYVREINVDSHSLSEAEKAEGFTSLFNGKDLKHWTGDKTHYIVKDQMLLVRPKRGEHRNLYTVKEYSDFILRFEFQLTPGANNGLGIHTPLEGDAAYVGKELQILDNSAPVYANLKPYQYHGSVYGIIPAKSGFLKPVGEWNTEEVYVNKDHIRVTLNGTVILDGNLKEATKNGTADHKEHPGLKRKKGHIAFLGHDSELQFRNIRIKELNN